MEPTYIAEDFMVRFLMALSVYLLIFTGPFVDIRLPTTVLPSHYEVTLRPDIYDKEPEDFIHTGSVIVNVTAKEATNVITMHTRSLTIEQSDVKVCVQIGLHCLV